MTEPLLLKPLALNLLRYLRGWHLLADPEHQYKYNCQLAKDHYAINLKFHKNRLVISNAYHPQHRPAHGIFMDHHAITIDPNRIPLSIANDIERRLLPQVYMSTDKALSLANEETQVRTLALENAQTVAKTLGHQGPTFLERNYTIGGHVSDVDYTVRVDSQGISEIKIWLWKGQIPPEKLGDIVNLTNQIKVSDVGKE